LCQLDEALKLAYRARRYDIDSIDPGKYINCIAVMHNGRRPGLADCLP
jgi:hypothetical protein